MKVLVLIFCCLYSYNVLAAPALATQEQIDADKKIIQDLVKTLKDSSKSPEDKKTTYTNAINSLEGPYKEQYDQLVSQIKTEVANLKSTNAKTAAEKFISLWESGALFGSDAKQQMMDIFSGLDPQDKEELHSLQAKFKDQFKKTFEDIMPPHSEEKTQQLEEKR